MNDILSLIAQLQPQNLERKIKTLEIKTGVKLKKPPYYHLISFDKEISNDEIVNFLKEIDSFYSFSQENLSTVKTELFDQIQSFQTDYTLEKQKIDEENQILLNKFNDFQKILQKLHDPTPENIAAAEISLDIIKNKVKILNSKEININDEYHALKEKEPYLEEKIRRKRKENREEIFKLRQKLDDINNLYNKNSTIATDLYISNLKQSVLTLQENLKECSENLVQICREKKKYYSKKNKIQKTIHETHNYTQKRINFVKNLKQIEEIKHKKKSVNKKLKTSENTAKDLKSTKDKMEDELKKIIEEINDENLRTELIEDTFFGDTEHNQIEFKPVPIQRDPIIPPENYFNEVSILKHELENDISSIQAEINEEKKQIMFLNKQINETILTKMENFDLDDLSSGVLITKQQKQLNIEQMEWRISNLQKEIQIKKDYIGNMEKHEYQQSDPHSPISFAILISNIESEIEKWKIISKTSISKELSKWSKKLSSFLSIS